MIALSDISYRYPNAMGPFALNRVSFEVQPGEYVLFCGASGSGKSTIAYLLNGLIPHFYGGEVQGAISVNGLDPRQVPVVDFLDKVGLVLQNSEAQLFNNTVENEIAYGLESMGIGAQEINRRIRHTASRFSIGHLLHRSPTTLSGGEKRIVAIASVLCMDPSILVLDEPFAHLDWEGTERVRNTLRKIHGEGKTVLVIEQRVEGLLKDVDRCLVFENGTIVFNGSSSEVEDVLKSHRLIPRYPEKKPDTHLQNAPILRVKDLHCRLKETPVLNGISFEAKQGQIVSIVGKNGAGKTTIVKHLNGLLKPDEGKILLKEQDTRGKDPSELASFIAVAFQNPNDQFFKSRVVEELEAGPIALGNRQDEWMKEICDLLDLGALLNQSPYRLSEGQKKRVSLATALTMNPKILVLDEPTVGQDGFFLETLASVLSTLKEHGVTVLLVTHDIDFARTVSDHWVVVHGGKVAAAGVPEQLIQNDELIAMGAIPPKAAFGFLNLRK